MRERSFLYLKIQNKSVSYIYLYYSSEKQPRTAQIINEIKYCTKDLFSNIFDRLS